MDYNYLKLPPFKFFILQNFPFIEADFDAITNYQLLCKLGEEINRIINTVNLTGQQVENLTKAFNDLKDYVDNYFKNLDVQDEIDNKLDDMAEHGELAEIIAQYLEVQAVLGFATTSDMSSAEYIANGSFMRTYGDTTINDGNGGFYFAREIINTDVIDGFYKVALNDENLVAVRCSDSAIDNLNTAVSELEGQVEFMNSKKVILIGDSYAQGYTPDGTVTNWQDLFISRTGLTNTIKKAYGGVGFCNSVDSKTFLTLLEDVPDDDNVTDIIVLGGYNDKGYSLANISTAISTFVSTANTNFPNAKVYIGFVGWTNQYINIYPLNTALTNYLTAIKTTNAIYLTGIEYCLRDYFHYFSSDGFHPNLNGQNSIANNLVQAWKSGATNMSLPYANQTLTLNSNISNAHWTSVGTTLNNNVVMISKQGWSNVDLVTATTYSGQNPVIEVGTITGGYMVGSDYGLVNIPTKMIINCSEGYFTVPRTCNDTARKSIFKFR